MLEDNILEPGQEICDGRFKVQCVLGSGAYGEIYKVEKLKNGKSYAAKVERAHRKNKRISLFWEHKLIKKLKDKTLLPHAIYIGTDKSHKNNHFHVMVMDLLGPSLEDLFQKYRRKFDLKTVCLTGNQMIERIQAVH